MHHGSGGVELDADSKVTKQDQMRSHKKTVRTPLRQQCHYYSVTLGGSKKHFIPFPNAVVPKLFLITYHL